MISVSVHKNKSVSIGLSGVNKIPIWVELLKENWPHDWPEQQIVYIDETLNVPSKALHPRGLRSVLIGDEFFPEGRPTCAECRWSLAARNNPSPPEAMTVIWWGRRVPTRYLDPTTNRIRPCESCDKNQDRLMEPIPERRNE